MVRLAILLTVLGALAASVSAHAATVGVVGNELRYLALPGERNSNEIRYRADVGGYVLEARDTQAGPGCAANEAWITCQPQGVEAVELALGDKHDHFLVGDLQVPMRLLGGEGTDSFMYVVSESRPMNVTADGKADDGPLGRDNVGTDVETVFGDSFADTLMNGPGGGGVIGRAGDDLMIGNTGDDVITAARNETDGTEAGFYFEGTDTVRCGRGRDLALIDQTDTVASDCEVVGKRTPGGFRFTGSHAADRIDGVLGWAPAAFYGRGGNDLLIAYEYGPTNVYGGTGNDRIQGGRITADALEGGSGNDRIRARDRRPVRDAVRCGPGRDTAIVDRLDSVSGCERVLRSR